MLWARRIVAGARPVISARSSRGRSSPLMRLRLAT
jgi:hypothetical protein